MLRYYSKEKGFEIIDEYVDDGYSGTTFNRPDLNRMIEDAMEDTQPSGIMVKDMSRFGRNNAMFMYYVEEIFPNNDILFIALNDDVDTRYEDNEMMPFKSIMNEYYARDTSKKIRSVKKTTALSGGFCGSFAPYGYRVDPNNKRKLLIDPETAPIVKRIFEMSKQGNSVHQIARTLCEEKILIPRAYRAMKNGTLETSTGFRFPTDWVGKNVKMILENQVYLGHMVSHKTQTKSFKNRKLVAVPKEDWIVVKNTHEAIIDEETFELVQKFISVKKRPNKTGRPNMFVGLVKCPDCGRNMAFSNPNGREPRFRCRTYARNSNLCTTHAISYDALVKIVMDDIQKHIKNMETLGDQFIEEMRVLSESGGGKKIKQFKQELELAEKRIAEIDSIIMKLFEQNVAGKISDGRFEKMSVTYENEQRELEERRKALKEKIEAEDYKTKNTNQFLETIRKYENVTELNRSMLVELLIVYMCIKQREPAKNVLKKWKSIIDFFVSPNVVLHEGNTRTTAVFIIQYLKTFGFRINNDVFADNSWYFRNALVRSNYNNFQLGIHATTKYLEQFFENLLMNANHELKNRYLHVDYRDETEIQSANTDDSKCKNCTLDCTLEEMAVLKVIKENPHITQKALAAALGKSERTIKTRMSTLQEKGLIQRKNGKRNGYWEILDRS